VRQGPEPAVYWDAVTVVYGQGESGWEPRVRTLQYSLDYDPDYLLYANYIPIHTLLMPRELYRKVGGFDEGLEYSEDWDFLIRLSAEAPMRHVRAVTCEYRVFEEVANDPGHAAAGSGGFQAARPNVYERHRARGTEAGGSRGCGRRSPRGMTGTASRRASCGTSATACAARPRRWRVPGARWSGCGPRTRSSTDAPRRPIAGSRRRRSGVRPWTRSTA